MPTLIDPHRGAIADLCARFGVARLDLFGSAATGLHRSGASDYDFLVELSESAPGSRAARLIDFAEALEALLRAPVDLVNPRYIRNPYFAAEVARTRVPIYDRSTTETAV